MLQTSACDLVLEKCDENKMSDINKILAIKSLKNYGDEDSINQFIKILQGSLLLDAASSEIFVKDIDRFNMLKKLESETSRFLRVVKNSVAFNDTSVPKLKKEIIILISQHVYKIRKNKQLTENLIDENDIFLPYSECVSENYLKDFMDSIYEFHEAIYKATQSIKPKRGSSITRNKKLNRINNLARFYISAFIVHFNVVPPVTRNCGPMVVFSNLIASADIQCKDVFYYYRKALGDFNKQKCESYDPSF